MIKKIISYVAVGVACGLTCFYLGTKQAKPTIMYGWDNDNRIVLDVNNDSKIDAFLDWNGLAVCDTNLIKNSNGEFFNRRIADMIGTTEYKLLCDDMLISGKNNPNVMSRQSIDSLLKSMQLEEKSKKKMQIQEHNDFLNLIYKIRKIYSKSDCKI